MTERDIFITATQIDDPDKRNAYLDGICGDDFKLRRRLERLLRSHWDAGSFLQHPAIHSLAAAADEGEWPSDTSSADSASLRAASHPDVSLDFLAPPSGAGLLGDLGSYGITSVVGRGGMGIVLKGCDAKLNRVVAIKVLAPELASNAAARKRFMREAQAAAAVSHDHVVTIHAVDDSVQLPYLVMEYVDGVSLQERIDQHGPLEAPRILRIARQTALGLAAAHEQGLIHRDIKPANILLENGVERVKITDFGLARTVDDVGVTQSGTVAGTPQYMSPEQAQGQQVDQRSDLFSLGSVIYAMCIGHSPFRAESMVAVLRRVCDDQPRPIPQMNPNIPGWLVQIVDRLLEKNPDHRFQSAAEVADLLGQGLSHVCNPHLTPPPTIPRTADSPQLPAGPAPAAQPTVELSKPTDGGTPKPLPPRRRWSLQAALTGVALAVLLIAFETTGLTAVSDWLAVVLWIPTASGTLVVQIDEPGVSVTIDGQDLVITGAGAQEIRLKPGTYRVTSARDGRPIEQELVTISRGGREIVRVGHLPAPLPAEPLGTEQPLSIASLVRQFTGTRGLQYRAGFAPDSRSVLSTSSVAEHAELWPLEDGPRRQFRGQYGVGVFTPDGQLVVTGSHHSQPDTVNQLVVWNANTGDELHRIDASSGVFLGLAIAPDGRTAASGHGQWWGGSESRDHAIRIWDLEAGQLVREIGGHTDQVMSVAFHPSGTQVASASRDGTVRMWDPESGEEIRKFRGTGTPAFAVDVSPDGQFVLAGFGPDSRTGIRGRLIDDPEHCIALLWDVETGEQVGQFVGHRGCLQTTVFSPDGSLVVTTSGEAFVGEPLPDQSAKRTHDMTTRFWDAATGDELGRIEHRTSPASAQFSADGQYLVTGEYQAVQVWKIDMAYVAIRDQLLVSSNHEGPFDIYLVHEDGTGWINLTNHPATDVGPAWSPDGETIAFASTRSGYLNIWLMDADGSNPRRLTDHEGIDRTPCWSPDGREIAFVRHLAPDNWEIFVMDADGTNLRNLSNHPARHADPAWSPDGSRIAFSFDAAGTQLYVMDADGANPHMVSPRLGSFIYPAWAPDGRRLVFTARSDALDDSLELFVVDVDGSNEKQLTQLGGLNTFAAWSVDGKKIAFQHRSPNAPGRPMAVYVMNADGTQLKAITGQHAYVGYGGGRPSWRPQ